MKNREGKQRKSIPILLLILTMEHFYCLQFLFHLKSNQFHMLQQIFLILSSKGFYRKQEMTMTKQ